MKALRAPITHARLRKWAPPSFSPPARRHSMGDAAGEIKGRLPEFVPFLEFVGVGAGWTLLDLAGHQLFPATEGSKTPVGYYGGKAIWSIPFLIAGRYASDFIGGSPVVRALTLGTIANSLMQVRYLLTMGPKFNWTVFLLHEAIVVPLSFLIIGKPGGKVY